MLEKALQCNQITPDAMPAVRSASGWLQPTDALLTVDQVADRLNVTKDWVWDHSSRKLPHLPVIRLSDGVLRYRASEIEQFISDRQRASELRRKRR